MDMGKLEWNYSFYWKWKKVDWLLKETENKKKATKWDIGLFLDF